MLQTRHRADKENQVHRPPKTPGPGKSIIAKTPFHDENIHRTAKKSVVFGQPDKHDVFQTPAPRRILGGKDLNTRQTPFQSVKPMQGQGGDAWSPPFTKPTHRRTSRRQSIGVRISPVKDVPVVQTVSADIEDIEYMPPTAPDIPFEPIDYEMDWDEYGRARQDISSYFLKLDEFGKSEMDYFVETKMDFGKDQELPICPPAATPKPINRSTQTRPVTKKWAPTKPVRPMTRPASRPVKGIRPVRAAAGRPKQSFMREDMKDEVAQLEREELEVLCKDDDFGNTFDLEL